MAAIGYPISGVDLLGRYRGELRRAALPACLRRGDGPMPAVVPSQIEMFRPPRQRVDLARERLDRRQAITRRRRIVASLATIGLFAGLWATTGALVSGRDPAVAVLPGSVAVHGGYRYLVRPGDTVWSIAQRLSPNADPRPLVDRLDAELNGAGLQAGMHLLVP